MVVNLARVSFSLYSKLMSPRDSRRAIHMWQEVRVVCVRFVGCVYVCVVSD